MTPLAERLAALKERLERLGATALPWDVVSRRVAELRRIPPETWATAGLAVDGYLAAAEDEWPSEVVEALERLGWAENWNPRALSFLVSPVKEASASGFVNGAKGTLFEDVVEHRVDDGLLNLPEGADGLALAKKLNQPGWDAELLQDDEVVGVVQMKATGSVDYLAEHFDRYPDIEHVIATSEVAEAAATRGMDVIDAGVENADLTATLQQAAGSLDAESLVREWIPATGLSVVLLRALKAHRGGASVEEVASILAEEGVTLVAAHAAGLAVETATGVVILRPVTSVGVRLARRRYLIQKEAREDSTRQRTLAEALAERSRAC